MDSPRVDPLPGFIEPTPPPRYCRRCQAPVRDVDDDLRCAVCGRPFDPNNPATYLDRREFSPWTYWFPGFCLPVAVGTICYAYLAQQRMDLPIEPLFFVVPFSLAIVVGYGTARAGLVVGLLLVLAAQAIAFAVAAGTATAGLEIGFPFWTAEFAAFFSVFLLPVALCGTGLGALLRIILLMSKWEQRWFLPRSWVRPWTMRVERLPTAPVDRNSPRRGPVQFPIKALLVFTGTVAIVLAILRCLEITPVRLGIGVTVIVASVLASIGLIHCVRRFER